MLRTISCVEGRSQSVEKAAAWPAIILMLNRSTMSPAFNWATLRLLVRSGYLAFERLLSSCHEHMAGSSWLDAKAFFGFVCSNYRGVWRCVQLFLGHFPYAVSTRATTTHSWSKHLFLKNWITEIFFQVFRVGLGVWANSMNKSTGRA